MSSFSVDFLAPLESRALTVLFLSRRNSARSIIAEALLNRLGKGGFMAMSAGATPADRVHVLARDLLNRNRLPTDYLRPKHVREFKGPYAQEFDFVISLGEFSRGESWEPWPGAPVRADWAFTDPVSQWATHEQLQMAFLRCYTEIERRLRLFVSLPLRGWSREAIRRRLVDNRPFQPRGNLL